MSTPDILLAANNPCHQTTQKLGIQFSLTDLGLLGIKVNRYIVVHQPFQFSVPRSLTRSRIYSHTIRRTLTSNVYILLIINMDDTERRTAKRSRFDQKEPEPKRTSRFDRRSRSPPARKFASRRSRSPIRRRSSRSPARESIKKDDVDPAAAAGIHTT